MLAPIVSLIRSVAWKFFPNVKSELKNPGPRNWLRRCVGYSPSPLAGAKSAELKHWLCPFSQLCCAFRLKSAVPVCCRPGLVLFAIEAVPSVTVKGKPLRVMKFWEKTQPPRMPFAARLLKW